MINYNQKDFQKKIINSLKSITKENENEDYEKFIDRSIRDKIGRKVKIADISDNLDISRLKEVTDKDILRINKYKKALEKLKQ